ncbi:MAG: His-Xaa-Ser system protein HxsD [Candidatus Acidiferrales bacterium]
MTIDVSFDLTVFSVDAVKAACYVFLDRFTPDIEISDRSIICHLTFSDNVSEVTAQAQVDRLKKEVLDQDLRLKLKAETEPIRNLILAHVFSKTGLIADE